MPAWSAPATGTLLPIVDDLLPLRSTDGGEPARRVAARRYPTAHPAERGCARCDGRDLSEEGVGFGVPVLRWGVGRCFPGPVGLATSPDRPMPDRTVDGHVQDDLVERLARAAAATVVGSRPSTPSRTRWPRCTGVRRSCAARSPPLGRACAGGFGLRDDLRARPGPRAPSR